MPEWLPGLIAQIPLVAAVAWGFLSRKLRTDGEVREAQAREAIERADRKEAERHLQESTQLMRDVLAEVQELTKEVIRHGPRR